MRQSKRSFVETIDFRTSPGNLGGAEQAERIRREGGWLGRGPSVVVTDLGIYHFDETGEMRLDSLHPGATLEEVRDTIGWDVKVAADLADHAAADRRGAAADPRGARPGRRLHEVAPPFVHRSRLRELDSPPRARARPPVRDTVRPVRPDQDVADDPGVSQTGSAVSEPRR